MTDYLDKSVVDELRLIMEDDIVVLFSAYLEDTQKRLIELDEAAKSGDCDQTRRIAHTLKGSSRNVGAVFFSEFCESLEQAARDEQLEQWTSLVDKMNQSFLATKALIEQEFSLS